MRSALITSAALAVASMAGIGAVATTASAGPDRLQALNNIEVRTMPVTPQKSVGQRIAEAAFLRNKVRAKR